LKTLRGATPYYDIRIVGARGREIAAGSEVRDKRQAESLAAAMRRALS